MNTVIQVLVRLAVLATALTLYTLLVVPGMSEPGDANIGAGLIAFGGLMLAGFTGGALDSWRHGIRTAVLWWLAVGALLAVGWWIALAIPEDSSMSFGELLALDVSTLPFTFGLVAGPAAVGALIGSIGRRD
jgi:hypothetical protein